LSSVNKSSDQIKQADGFRQFAMAGIHKMQPEWQLA